MRKLERREEDKFTEDTNERNKGVRGENVK
jgi:hypothetical protein